MKKKIIIVVVLVLIYLFLTPKYNELNNLVIVQDIGVELKDEIYTLYLKEIIPIKDDSGLTYKYKTYQASSTNIKKALNQIKDKTSKKIYLKKTKSLIINTSSDEIITKLKINPKYIIHKEDIEKEIKSN